MHFLTYGDSTAPVVMLIHGMATTAEICYSTIAEKLSRYYYVILAKLDGHDPDSDCGDIFRICRSEYSKAWGTDSFCTSTRSII